VTHFDDSNWNKDGKKTGRICCEPVEHWVDGRAQERKRTPWINSMVVLLPGRKEKKVLMVGQGGVILRRKETIAHG